jgi:hypothetical protein
MEPKEYGTHPGNLNEDGIKMVKEGTEQQVYFLIETTGGFIWHMNHDASHGRVTMTPEVEEDLLESQYAIEFTILNGASRFGVTIPLPAPGEHVKATERYWRWFRWWDAYIKGLPEAEWCVMENLMNINGDYSMYRPKGDWR